jgi:hypothetical protein
MGSRDCVQPAETFRTRLNAEGKKSPMGVAHEPVVAMTEGNALRGGGTHLPDEGNTEVAQRGSGHLAASLGCGRPA